MLACAEGRRRVDQQRNRAGRRTAAEARAVNEKSADTKGREARLILAQPIARGQTVDSHRGRLAATAPGQCQPRLDRAACRWRERQTLDPPSTIGLLESADCAAG